MNILHNNDATRMATIRYDSEVREWRVTLRVLGVPQPGATYYTDDKQDAYGTARLMVNGTNS